MSEGEIKFSCPICNFRAARMRQIEYVTIEPDHIWAVKTETHVIIKHEEWDKIIKFWKEHKRNDKTQ